MGKPLTRRTALLEVTAAFIVAIGLLKLLDSSRGVPLISDYFAVFVPAVFIYTPIAVLYLRRASFDGMGFGLERPGRAALYALGATAIVLPLFVLGFKLYSRVLFDATLRFRVPQDAGEVFLYQLLCVALPEEFFYRGYVQSRLHQAFPHSPHWLGCVFSVGFLYANFLFALGHPLINFDLTRFATFVPGLMFAWLRERTGSVYAGAFFHTMCNMTMIGIHGG